MDKSWNLSAIHLPSLPIHGLEWLLGRQFTPKALLCFCTWPGTCHNLFSCCSKFYSSWLVVGNSSHWDIGDQGKPSKAQSDSSLIIDKLCESSTHSHPSAIPHLLSLWDVIPAQLPFEKGNQDRVVLWIFHQNISKPIDSDLINI